jgi:coproporphyrinogen III oxidase-like Fe-S oxidoreductase
MKKFSKQESMHYYFLMKLFGLSMDKSAFEKKFGKSLEKAMPLEKMMLKLSSSVKETEKTITLTEKGMYYWIMAMREFFIATDNLRDHCRSLVKGPS